LSVVGTLPGCRARERVSGRHDDPMRERERAEFVRLKEEIGGGLLRPHGFIDRCHGCSPVVAALSG
jgi:hypothetical protein